MIRDERWAETVSLDAPKISNIHNNSGNQYRAKLRKRNTAQKEQASTPARNSNNATLIRFAKRARLWHRKAR